MPFCPELLLLFGELMPPDRKNDAIRVLYGPGIVSLILEALTSLRKPRPREIRSCTEKYAPISTGFLFSDPATARKTQQKAPFGFAWKQALK